MHSGVFLESGYVSLIYWGEKTRLFWILFSFEVLLHNIEGYCYGYLLLLSKYCYGFPYFALAYNNGGRCNI